MVEERFECVSNAIGKKPGETEIMKLRSTLMKALAERIRHDGLNQPQAAALLGVTQPRISELLHGKIHRFGLASLINMAAAVGLKVELRVMESKAS
jgi:predicted XRE-type DNA-binding protein